MKSNIFLIVNLFLLSSLGCLNAQSNENKVVMKIGDSNVTIEEFENVYHKNNNIKTSQAEKSLDEYVELFVNFKLKVKDAEAEGLDTAQKFITELAGYRKQLANTYLTDGGVNEMLIQETYERLKEELCVSHILIKCPETALPADSLKAYNKVWSIYHKIKKGGSFESFASNKAFNDDTMLVAKAGYIGCYTAMDLVYPFETVAYSTKTGEVSEPVRTRFGYHIIKVNERRKAHGEVLTAHIMLKNPSRMTQMDSLNQTKKITEIYDKLKAGESFEKLAKEYSEDKQTAVNGGNLPWIGINKTPVEFEEVAFALKNKGDFSKPVRTPYGVHIIKLIDKKELGSFDESKSDIKMKLSKISRFSAGQTALVEKLKKEYAFEENKKSLIEFYKIVDTNLFYAKWSPAKIKELQPKSVKELFRIKDKTYSQLDFASYIEKRQTKSEKMDIKMAVDRLYDQFVNESIIAFEDEHLEEKYPKFRALMQEYRDGILLFDITNMKVWSKAVKNTSGLAQYYQENKNKYTWGDRADASIYKCANKEIAGKVKKMLKKGKKEEEILKTINKKSQLNLSVESKHYAMGENALVDKSWAVGVSQYYFSESDNKVIIVNVNEILKDELKMFEEAKGAVISDYQAYLEKEWLKELKDKYTVEINSEVLKLVK